MFLGVIREFFADMKRRRHDSYVNSRKFNRVLRLNEESNEYITEEVEC